MAEESLVSQDAKEAGLTPSDCPSKGSGDEGWSTSKPVREGLLPPLGPSFLSSGAGD